MKLLMLVCMLVLVWLCHGDGADQSGEGDNASFHVGDGMVSGYSFVKQLVGACGDRSASAPLVVRAVRSTSDLETAVLMGA
jgi:hypothetical protein